MIQVMDTRANTAGTKDWLEVTKGMTILSYVEPQWVILGDEGQLFTRTDFEKALKKVSRQVSKK